MKNTKQLLMAGWEVEVCVEVPRLAGTDDADMDNAKYRRFDVPTRAAAVKLAKELLHQDQLGGPVIQEFRRELYEPDFPAAGYHKEYIGERECPLD